MRATLTAPWRRPAYSGGRLTPATAVIPATWRKRTGQRPPGTIGCDAHLRPAHGQAPGHDARRAGCATARGGGAAGGAAEPDRRAVARRPAAWGLPGGLRAARRRRRDVAGGDLTGARQAGQDRAAARVGRRDRDRGHRDPAERDPAAWLHRVRAADVGVRPVPARCGHERGPAVLPGAVHPRGEQGDLLAARRGTRLTLRRISGEHGGAERGTVIGRPVPLAGPLVKVDPVPAVPGVVRRHARRPG